ncbi:MAG: lysophospholipid acyltransferase family protein [bacterium]
MFFIRLYLKANFKVKVIGKENIPKKGGVIICSNHMSNYDSLIICTNVGRKVNYFAKKELFSTPFKNFWMRQLGAFPVDREKSDISSLKTSINILKNNGALGIFAQGTRVKDDKPVEAKNGVSLFALKAEVDVLPIGITSSYKKGEEVIVTIGKPISFEKYKGQKPKTELLTNMTSEIMIEIDKLLVE